MHGIIIINGCADTACHVSTKAEFGKPIPGSLGTIIRSYKSAATREVNILRKSPGSKLWQSNYYEHIIRNEKDLDRVRKYIKMNPLKW